jgi:hypothetical protein
MVKSMERYTIENIKKVLQQPEYVGWEIQRLLFDYRFGNEAVDVMVEDWDTLILLDACRHDYFKSQSQISGELTSIISNGGRSWEFMKENFVGREFHDTVYITANPHTEKLDGSMFHAVEPLYIDEWNEEHETVLPDDVTEAAINAHNRYPEKRVIVHYMQPHRPYLGDTAAEIQRKHDTHGFNRNIAHSNETPDGTSFSTLVETGDVSIQKTRVAYRETLDIVLNSVSKLIQQISGKIVVSADHGEMLGERILPFTTPKFGHSHQYIRNKTLYKVPWLEIPSTNRRNVTSDEPVKFDQGDSTTVADRLTSLGYKT